MYREVTRDIQVEVEPQYVPEESDPEHGYYFYTYRVRITNLGSEPAKLTSRNWVIRDGFGHVQEGQWEGVVGFQPKIAPKQAFEYSCFCPLSTPTGNMRGAVQVTQNGESYDAKIPLFFFRDNRILH